jgi:D-alanyl-D-alanine carboxypeptidase
MLRCNITTSRIAVNPFALQYRQRFPSPNLPILNLVGRILKAVGDTPHHSSAIARHPRWHVGGDDRFGAGGGGSIWSSRRSPDPAGRVFEDVTVQYTRTFGPSRLIWTVLVALVVCAIGGTSAEAGRRHKRHVRLKAHSVVSKSDDIARSSRYAAIVIDDKTGKVLYAKNADAPRHPASLTKMMTLYLLFEDMRKHKVSLSSRLTASAKASAQAPTKLGLRPGQTIAVEDAIRALVTKSANDVAVTVAENLGGTEQAFARRMTATARRLGMRGTTFYNASGLPNDAQYTTARDMVILGRALQERFPSQYRYFATRSFAWGNSVHGNHNKLLYRLDGIDGIKTGYTNASGFNLVSSFRRDGRHLVAAVMGGSSGRSRDDHMASLLTAYLPRASGGAKVSSVFDEVGGIRTADAGDDEIDTAVPLPTAAPARVAALPAEAPERSSAVADRDPPAQPMALMAMAPAPAPTPVVTRGPRIAASDVVPLAGPEHESRTSADRGAAVAMARAIMLPRTGQPLAPLPEAAVRARPASMPIPQPAPQAERRPQRPVSLASATIPSREVAATTGTLPRHAAPEPAPLPPPKLAHHQGWMVQIGAYDTEKAARTALEKAKGKGGSVVARADAFTEPANTGSGRLWRARFAGFADQKRAEDACRALKRKDFACLALRQ